MGLSVVSANMLLVLLGDGRIDSYVGGAAGFLAAINGYVKVQTIIQYQQTK